MNARLVLALVGVVAATAARAQLLEREENVWPILVRYQETPGAPTTFTGAGPFLFRTPNADAEGNTVKGFRPFWVQFENPQGGFREGHFLYPLFSYSVDETIYRWSFFELIRSWGRRAGAPAPTSTFERRGEFEVFPIWFSRETGDPEMSYWGLFPIYGTVKNKLGFDRLSWVLFPLYLERDQRGAVTTSTPWPVIRVTRGAGHGWGIWPLFNYVVRPGVSRYETYLWPLGFNATRYPYPDDPPGTPPRRDYGFLPFYAKSSGPGYVYENYLWPFFGYADRQSPIQYHERRYFWPLLVQGRGEHLYVNRWAPFYTHSNWKGYDKRWFLWPLLRRGEWTERGVTRTRTQLFYFVYWNEEQHFASRPNGDSARLTHIWPFFSRWDGGAGREQWQVFSPFDVFFLNNYKFRHVWSPLVAIARHERRGPGHARTSLLWNAITWSRHSDNESREFHIGPLFGITRRSGEQRVSVGNGLFGFHRSEGGGWRMFWLDFPGKSATNSAAPR